MATEQTEQVSAVDELTAEVEAHASRMRELQAMQEQERQQLEQTEGRIFGLLTTTSMLLGKPAPMREPLTFGPMQGPPTLEQAQQADAREGTMVQAIIDLLRQHGPLKVAQIEGYLKGMGRAATYGSIYATLSKAADRFEKVDAGTFKLRGVDNVQRAG